MTTSVGLDIRENGVRVVELTRKNDQVRISKFGSIRVAEEGGAALSTEIRRLLQTLDIRTNTVATSLRGSFVLTRAYSLSYPEFPVWVRQNLTQVVPGIPPEQAIIEYDFLSDDKVLIVVARREILDQFVHAIRQSGLLPTLIDAGNLALIEAFKDHPYLGNATPSAILEVSPGLLSMVAVSGLRPLVSTEIRLPKSNRRQFSQDVCHELGTVLEYYRSRDGLEITNFILTGAKASSSLARSLGKDLKKEVEVAIPGTNIKAPASMEGERSAYAQAIGLALRGLAPPSDRHGINLAPKDVRDEIRNGLRFAEIVRLAKVMSFAFASIFGVLFVLTILAGRHVRSLKEVESALAVRLDSIPAYESFEVEQRVSMLRKLLDRKITWSRILHDVGLAAGRNVQFSAITSETRMTSSGDDDVTAQTLVALEGEAVSSEAVLAAVARLEQCKDLKMRKVERIESGDKWQFRLIYQVGF